MSVQMNRWHPVMLPDDYLRKLKQDLAESDASSESSRLEPDQAEIDAPPPDDRAS